MSDRADPSDLYERVLARGRFLDRLEPLDPLEVAMEHGLDLIAAADGAIWTPEERAP
jgi:hypothetical protein